ncbi:MAG TPA: hypothetical protein VEZ89_16680, partial [Rubrivivax sp.]|nr:hypothetical protein [Rubrivivax sp.]
MASNPRYRPDAAPRGAYVAIDFGTSNSAVALPCTEAAAASEGNERGAGSEDSQGTVQLVKLVKLENGSHTMPTAVFYRADTPQRQFEADRLYGRAALA